MRRQLLPVLLAVLLLAPLVLAAEYTGTVSLTRNEEIAGNVDQQEPQGQLGGGTSGIYSGSNPTCLSDSYCGTGRYCVHGTCRSASTYCGDSYCDTGETCTACSGDCGACATTVYGRSSDFVLNKTIEEVKVETAKDLVKQAEELISSSPSAATVLLESATKQQQEVVTTTKADVVVMDALYMDTVSELDITSNFLTEGKALLAEAENLIAKAEATTDLKEKAHLLTEAATKQADALQLLPEATVINEAKDTVVVTSENVKAAMETATSAEARSALESIYAAIPASGSYTISREMTSYKITNKETTTKSADRSKITLKVSAKDDLTDVVLVENIPKSVAQSVSELLFPEMPTILQADPIVQWTLSELKAGQEKTFSYVVRKALETVPSGTVLSATTVGAPAEEEPIVIAPPPEEKLPEVKPVSTYLMLLLLVIILIALYYVVLTKDRRRRLHGKIAQLLKRKARVAAEIRAVRPKAREEPEEEAEEEPEEEELAEEVEKVSRELEALEKTVAKRKKAGKKKGKKGKRKK